MTIKSFAALAACCALVSCSSFDYAPSGRFAQDDTVIGRFAQDDTVIGRFAQDDTVIGRFAQDSGAPRSVILSGAPRSVILSGAPQARNRRTPIKHVVFVVQENRSFNDLFMGYPGATTARYGYDRTGKKIALQPIGLVTSWDIEHSAAAFFAACDGRGKLRGTDCAMDGWNGEKAGLGHPDNYAYAYVPRDEIEPYWTLARQYVLGDETFASNLDGSFVAHQYVVAAYSSRAVDYPLSIWGCGGGTGDTVPTLTPRRGRGPEIRACFENPTIASEADAAGVSWRFYADSVYGSGGLWSSYQADKAIFDGPDWKNDIVDPPGQFLTDVGHGKLAAITWIAPTFDESDHPGESAGDGPAWVASVVNAVGESKFWDSTAIFILWDDWGGWFDPVKPPYLDYDGLGFRIPLIVVSAYAKKGSVTHTRYETASVLRFIEDAFGLAPMAASDGRAADPAGDPAVFDFMQSPRAFQKIGGERPAAYWHRRETSTRAAPPAVLGDD